MRRAIAKFYYFCAAYNCTLIVKSYHTASQTQWSRCLLLGFLLIASVLPAQRMFYNSLQKEVERSKVFAKGFTGFHLVEIASGRIRCAVNADRYFTPASNTKILTLAACLGVLGDSLTNLEYALIGDSLGLLRGTADPTFLHPAFAAFQPGLRFLQQQRQRKWLLHYTNWEERHYGPGWAWDDYNDDYAPERTAFPVFGNVFQLTLTAPGPQKVRLQTGETVALVDARGLRPSDGIVRAENGNVFYKAPGYRLANNYQQTIPMWLGQRTENRNMPQAVAPWLRDTLRGLSLQELPVLPTGAPNLRYTRLPGIPVDTVCRLMMQVSDNFLAEQLLLHCAWKLSDTIRQSIALDYVQKKIFPVSPTPPKWVDGSGLSRYNLFAPQFMTALLIKMYGQTPQKRLFSLFPAGGVSGTIEDLYTGPNGKPFVFAKTGTLSGVHCLSGYIITKKGKVLAFSFMHNNFIGSSRPWREEMQRLFRLIWEKG